MNVDSGVALQQTLLSRVLSSHDAARLHVRFDIVVIERYRELAGAQLLRTRSVGRIVLRGRWSLDVGISADESEVHAPAQDLFDRLPAEEHAHWLAHLVPQPYSANFLQMRMAAGACIDDGEPVTWA